MRVFHFVPAGFGLEDIYHRRLKIATINELNDPFELFGVNLANENLRLAFRAMKQELSENRGLLCFSRSWRNPVQWSHYASRHTGICLGFDVPEENLGAVHYSRSRLVVEIEKFTQPADFDPVIAQKLLFTKYTHWKWIFRSCEATVPDHGKPVASTRLSAGIAV